MFATSQNDKIVYVLLDVYMCVCRVFELHACILGSQ